MWLVSSHRPFFKCNQLISYHWSNVSDLTYRNANVWEVSHLNHYSKFRWRYWGICTCIHLVVLKWLQQWKGTNLPRLCSLEWEFKCIVVKCYSTWWLNMLRLLWPFLRIRSHENENLVNIYGIKSGGLRSAFLQLTGKMQLWSSELEKIFNWFWKSVWDPRGWRLYRWIVSKQFKLLQLWRFDAKLSLFWLTYLSFGLNHYMAQSA